MRIGQLRHLKRMPIASYTDFRKTSERHRCEPGCARTTGLAVGRTLSVRPSGSQSMRVTDAGSSCTRSHDRYCAGPRTFRCGTRSRAVLEEANWYQLGGLVAFLSWITAEAQAVPLSIESNVPMNPPRPPSAPALQALRRSWTGYDRATSTGLRSKAKPIRENGSTPTPKSSASLGLALCFGKGCGPLSRHRFGDGQRLGGGRKDFRQGRLVCHMVKVFTRLDRLQQSTDRQAELDDRRHDVGVWRFARSP